MKRTWRAISAVFVVAVFVGFLGAVTVEQAMAQAKGPADFDFPGGAEGKVNFSHAKHLTGSAKCTDCHTKIFKMAKGQRSSLKMADMEKGQACGACHNGKATFDVKDKANCTKCHKK